MIRWLICLATRRWSRFTQQAYTDVLEENQITANGDWRISLIYGCAWFEGFYVVWRMRRGTARVIRQGCTFGEAVYLIDRYATGLTRKKARRDFHVVYPEVVRWGRRGRTVTPSSM